MTDFFVELLRSLIALGIVIAIVLLVLPRLPKVLTAFRLPMKVEGSAVNIKRVIPINKLGTLVEMEIRNKLYVVYFTNSCATIVYREDEGDNANTSS